MWYTNYEINNVVQGGNIAQCWKGIIRIYIFPKNVFEKYCPKCDATVFDLGYITDHTLGTRVAIKISTNHLW